ncbi:adenylate/guanylate cyclase domain-containing protein [Nocardioides sp. HM23]|uniref:adenylate/guanylate cyclase domain-containing protein n=1 Tax=Nocardioides bizhenqiangii TaxID=3095076 RepID=UPI002ACA27B1|nr:adenylate/guanylate cyclase domain-containing protein [Nocardioides sp. HM23]MDZ5623225.1 adenylate/guanylate cyclase domain-containing protein [Nocardioides sp. HM23]
MLDRITERLYERLGSRYWLVLAVGQAAVSILVALVTVVILASYYDASTHQVARLATFGSILTAIAIFVASLRTRSAFCAVRAWHDTPAPTATETVSAWETATTLTYRQFRRNSWWINPFVVLPTSAFGVVLFDLEWTDFFVLVLACIVPAVYATVLSYSAGEMLSRPMVGDIAKVLPDDFPFTRLGLPVRKRILLGPSTYTVATALLVASLLGDRSGSDDLVLAVVASVCVGLALSHELSVLLAEAITRPIERVRVAMARVADGDLAARVPVTTSDELGELAHDFNLMARGLEEREQMRAAFGTYVDKEVAALILSGQFPEEGVEVEVSIMFCDVIGFTSYAESAPATAVVATLNRLFSVMVPIVDKHGGHVDKFIGDGLLAVFGAPELFPDHADRAVAAAREIVAAAAALDTGLSVAAGVNTGRVVAGSIGGAGRLNFSVIGDAVNVAARVEAATRQTGDDVLITAATAAMLTTDVPLVSRGSVPLKGKAEPLEVLAPLGPVTAPTA